MKGGSVLSRWAFFVFLVWVPIPLGSNRPVFWLANSVVVIAIFALMLATARRTTPNSATRTLAFMLMASLVLVAWILFQASGWTPDALHHQVWTEFGTGESGAISANPSATYTAAIVFLTGALSAIVAMRLSLNPIRSNSVVWAVVASTSLVAIWGLTATAFGWPQTIIGDDAKTALTSFFVNRNTTATILGLGLVAAVALVMARMRTDTPGLGLFRTLLDLPARAGGLLTIIVILGVALVATGSRAGVVAGAIGVVLVFLLSWRRQHWAPMLIVAVPLVIVGVAVLLLGTSSDLLFDRFADLEIAGEKRWSVYRDTLTAIGGRPILGHGAGTFVDIFPLYHSAETPSTGIWLAAHNSYLQAAADLGLPAFAASLLLMLLFIVRCARVTWSRPSAAAAAAVGAAAVVGAHSLFDFSLQVEAVAVVFAALLGAGIAAAVRQQTETTEPVEQRYQTISVLPESRA